MLVKQKGHENTLLALFFLEAFRFTALNYSKFLISKFTKLSRQNGHSSGRMMAVLCLPGKLHFNLHFSVLASFSPGTNFFALRWKRFYLAEWYIDQKSIAGTATLFPFI